jgi:hypothetical protein
MDVGFAPNVPQAQKLFSMHPMELLGDVGHVDLILVHLEIVLVSVQDRCKVCAKRTTGLDIFWAHPMELLGDVGHVESRSGLFGDSISVGARYWHGLCQTYHRLRNHFGHTRS